MRRNIRRLGWVVCLLVFVAAMFGGPYYILNHLVVIGRDFSGYSTVTCKGKTFYLIPHSSLDNGSPLIDKDGKPYYILSEEQLRLIGPEFLSKLKGVGND